MQESDPTTPALTLLGVPLDENSSFLRGPAEAPAKIREALLSDAGNLTTESGLDLSAASRFQIGPDLDLGQGDAAIEDIDQQAAELLESSRILALGGDHSVSWPLIRSHARHHGPLQILHFDAHPDLYEELDGNHRSHACPFARIMEEGLASRLVQVGIRTLNSHQQRQAERFGVEMVEMRHLGQQGIPRIEAPYYLSVDLDVLDPAFAPGVSHHEPGGMSTRELLGYLQTLPHAPVGADLVELNPRRDPLGITTALAAKLVKEIAALMLTPTGGA